MKETIQKISIAGNGNVAHHLIRRFYQNQIHVSHLLVRNLESAKDLNPDYNINVISDPAQLPPDQLCLLCVPDDIVAKLIRQIHPSIKIAYTSGSVGLNELPMRSNLGVFYPLQTFTKTSEREIAEIPLLIEANNKGFHKTLMELAHCISTSVYPADSTQRKDLHLAAVWVNNFTNHMLYHAQEIASERQVDFKLLLPLLNETIAKLTEMSAKDAQTGPARREDETTLQAQSSRLTGLRKDLYDLISKSIKETYRK